MKTKILVFGVSSYLMTKFLYLIDFNKYEVIGVSRQTNININKNIRIICADIQEINKIYNYISQSDIIIHAAAITHSFKSSPYYKINLEATKKIVDVAKLGNVKRFVFISSNTAGKNSGTYGLTKFLAENYIKENLKNYTIFRPSEIFGSNKNEGIEKLIYNSINSSFVLCPLNIPTKFYPIHINDAVKLMFDRTFDEKYLNQSIIISGVKSYSFKQVIKLAKKISNNKIRIIYIRRNFMFLIKNIAQILPFSVGIIPDQITRLYCVKESGKFNNNFIDLEKYIKYLVETA